MSRIIEYHPDLKVGGVTVKKRAARANLLLSAYAREVGVDTLRACITDLLTDVIHLSRSTGVSEILGIARAAVGHARYESDLSNHEGDTPPPPFVVNPEAFPIKTRYYVVSGRLPHEDDYTCVVELEEDEERDAWSYFVEEVLFGGGPPHGWADESDPPAVVHSCVIEIPGPPLSYE